MTPTEPLRIDPVLDAGDAPALPRILDGVRILDFSWSVAGPTVARIAAAMGAEVMKVEWPAHPDPMRTAMYAEDTEPNIDNGSFFAGLNIGKESLTIDAGSAPGRGVVRRLIERSDIVLESFSARMLRRWNLDYDTMAAIHPGVIYLSISGFGHSGPYETYDTWGPTAQAFAGLTATSGLPGHDPAGWGFSYMDLCAGYLSTFALLSALHERRVSGVGQHIDVAQAEVGISLTGAAMLDAQVNDRFTPRPGFPPGNRATWPGLAQASGLRGETGAPYGLYPTADAEREEAYCAITVLDDRQWEALRDVMGDPEWAADRAYAGYPGRVRHQEEIDREIAAWTSRGLKHDIQDRLQAAGVPAGAVQNARELLDLDPQIAARGVFEEHDHPLLGRRRFESVPITYSETPVAYREVWPVLSSGNARILGEVAGLDAEEIEQLEASHVTWPDGMPRYFPVRRPLW